MKPDDFKKLIEDFEKNIIVGGILDKRFIKKSNVSTKKNKLLRHDFGKVIGEVVDTRIILAIDYYGYIKKSIGFLNKFESINPRPKEIRSYLVYFASIRMEDIVARTNDIKVMLDFPRLKNEILILRGFRKKA